MWGLFLLCLPGHPQPALLASCPGEIPFLGGYEVPSSGFTLSLLPQGFSISRKWLGQAVLETAAATTGSCEALEVLKICSSVLFSL